ncbi:MAG: galactokinase [Anaerolineae bacterium]|nr:galactokinase [Anaerolineae bacterium]
MNQAERRDLITNEFFKRFNQTPTEWVRAPGRVDLMGSHTDYNQGYVMTMAINRDTWLAARPRSDRHVVVYSLNLAGESKFSLDHITHDTITPWTNYVRGVAQVFQAAGYALPGFDGLIHSTIPFGAGLSSSAAIEVVIAMMFNVLAGNREIDWVELAQLCQRAENEFVGVNSGILDQYSSVMGQAGQALLLDCRHLTSQTATLPAHLQVAICDTRAKRELTGSEYGQRRAQCEEGARRLAAFYPGVVSLRDVSLAQFSLHEHNLPEVVARRCRFIIEENQRVLALAKALAADDLTLIKTLTAESYTGARDLYQISCREMEAMIQAMNSGPGVIGARQAGAGFGGCMIAFVEQGAIEAFSTQVKNAYQAMTTIEPKVYPVEAVAGAGRVSEEIH